MLLSSRSPENPAMLEIPIPLEVWRNMEPNARHDPVMLSAIAEEWPLYLAELESLMEMADDGVPIEDFVGVYQRIMRLSAYGVKFSPFFIDWFDGMRREIVGSDDDTDRDDADDFIDRDGDEPEVDDSEHESDDSECESDDEDGYLGMVEKGWDDSCFPAARRSSEDDAFGGDHDSTCIE